MNSGQRKIKEQVKALNRREQIISFLSKVLTVKAVAVPLETVGGSVAGQEL